VVLIDVEVALRLQFQIEAAVPREQFQHVIEEADASGDLILAATVHDQNEAYVGLVGLAAERGSPN
jgi:hypothetical protein